MKVAQAVLPARPIENGRPGPGLLAHVVSSKYRIPRVSIHASETSPKRIHSTVGECARLS
jgi:transposase